MQRTTPLQGEAGCRGGTFRQAAATLLIWICVVFCVLSPPCSGVNPSPESNVLILHSFTLREDIDAVEVLESAMRSRSKGPVNFHVEYLESQRFSRPGYEKGLADTLKHAYGSEKLDLVVAFSYPALRFASDHRDQIFPGVPIVFTAVAPARVKDRKQWPGTTGVTIPVDIPGTIDLALRVDPDTKNVAVVTGTSEFEHYWQAATDQAVRAHNPPLQLIDLVGLPTTQLLERVSALPSHTSVIFELVPLDSSQPVMGPFDILATIALHFPVYCIHNYCLDKGAIGGSYPDSDEQRLKAAELGLRILGGEKADDIPVVQGTDVRAMVDWRQLARWNPNTTLPPGTIVRYRQPTLWQRYEKYLIVGIVLIMAQALLILGLLWQRARKRKAEAILRESEKRFRVMADTTPALVWMSDTEGRVFYQNETSLQFIGDGSSTASGVGWSGNIHPDDLQKVTAANQQAQENQKGFSKEYRLRRADGIYRWMLDVAAPRVNGDGTFAGFIGSASDVTDQKLAQDALEKMGGRLIEAQEKERTRIARELHDDICQRLALISLELQHAQQDSDESDTVTKARIVDVQKHCAEVAGDVQALSHQLHSSKLDYLGLASALRSFCKEFSKQQNADVEFKADNVPQNLPKDLSLCLFRVAQEALSNAVKYSGVGHVLVELRSTADEVRLSVSDAGVGFDVDAAKDHAGLGLVSMQERVHLVNGAFSIVSKCNRGTTIVATIPLQSGASEFSASA